MITIKQSKYKLWWKNEGEDFPSLKILKEFNESFTDSIYKLNYINQFSAQVIIEAADINITAFKVESSENFDTQILIIKSIDKKTSDEIIILNLGVDLFSTYAYKLLELPNKFLTKRTHKFNKLSFQMEDGLLNSIPVYYDKNVVVEKRYPSMTGDSTNTSNQTKIRVISKTLGTFYTDIQNPDNNANIYYAFGCGTDIKDTTKFTLLPYLGDVPSLYLPKPSETLETIIFNSKSKWEDVLTKIKAYQDKHFTVKLVVEPNFNPNFDFINNYNSYDYDYTIPSNKISINLEDKIKYWDYFGAYGAAYAGDAYTINNINVNIGGRNLSGNNEVHYLLVYPTDTPIIPDADYPVNTTWEDEANNYIKLTIIGQKRYNSNIVLKNTLRNINELLKNPELINKFQGIFFLPNLTNFTVIDPRDNVGVFKDFITVEIGPEGIDLPNFSICNQIKLNNFQESRLKWNNDFITSILFLKYFDITYYSNTKNWNFYFDFDTTSLNLSGKFTFNGVGSIVSNIGIDKTYNNIIEFPYQLPSALDQYTKYYSGIMNSTNTGMEAQKKTYEINKAQHGMNTALSAFSAAPSIAGNIASGNLIGGVSDVIGMGGNLGNALFDSQKMDLGNSMYYKNLGAKFTDIQRTQTTNFSNSSITDLSFIFSNTGKFNSEQIQMKKLTKESIINVNNHIYLYGYQNVGWYNWSQLLQYTNFNFVEFEHNELVRIILNDLDFKVNNIYEIVINFWGKGRRIWNNKPNKNENILKVSFRDEK